MFSGILPNGLPVKVKAATNDDTKGACRAQRVAMINGDFEQPSLPDTDGYLMFPQDSVLGWKTTDSLNQIEIWKSGMLNVNSLHGNQFAELNANSDSMLYQDIKTVGGETIYWRLSHRGRGGVDKMRLRVGPVGQNPSDTPEVQQMSDGTDKWGTYKGTYTVPNGQTTTRFGFEAVSAASGNLGQGNFLDDIFIGTPPCVKATKSVDKDRIIHAGDELTYTVNIKNEGGDIADNSVFTDMIPDGTEYVPGSIKVTKAGTETNVTDAVDGDIGNVQNNKVTVNLERIPIDADAPEGLTVKFKVKAKSDSVGKIITNKAQVQYQDLLQDQQRQTETNEVVNEIVSKDPVIESEKTVRNIQNKNTEVGDTLEYTIRTHNTFSDSLVKNLVIADTLPEGLEYVPGTLQVDGQAVTDAVDTDKGQFETGKVTGKFGDVADTNWHTVVLHAKVKAGQAGKNIINTGNVTGDNVTPQEPKTETPVYPRNPTLESEKTVKNVTSQSTKNQIGDELEYTIRTRNKVSDSLVKNLVIGDTLPEGLEYVPGTLQVDGKAVTDAEDKDNGQFVKGTLTGKLGDVTDTEWHTVVFHAKIKSGQSGKTITNTGDVTGEGVPPQHPKVDTPVDQKAPTLESEKTAKNLQNKKNEVGDELEYTIRTRNKVSDSLVKNLVIGDTLPEGLEYVPGTLQVDGKAVTDAEDKDNGQ
ncbi:isopeptide-forming domain-containing fimbrial protein, partial [Bacillus cereus]|uniref:isopeptide-forming domain-containing fimbrial protein n=3 Tax=Bacillus cereus group TaxID=86661 RepID=UPI0021128552